MEAPLQTQRTELFMSASAIRSEGSLQEDRRRLCSLNPAAGDVRGGLSVGRDAARPPVRREPGPPNERSTGTQEAPN